MEDSEHKIITINTEILENTYQIIIEDVKAKFNITLEREVNIL